MIGGGLFLRYLDPWFVEFVRVKAFDAYNRMEPREPDPAARVVPGAKVVIVDIDEKSLARIGQWPWPRTVVADLIAALRDYGVGVIGFDVVFAEPDRTSPGRIAETLRGAGPEVTGQLKALPSNEEVMAETMRTMRVVMGQASSNSAAVTAPTETAKYTSVRAHLGTLGATDTDPRQYLFRKPTLVHNLEVLEGSASGLGFFSVEEEVDGVVRRVPLVMEIAGVVKPTLSVEMLRVGFSGNSIVTVVDPGGMHEIRLQTPGGNFPIPVDGRGRLWVYYAEPDNFNTPNNSGRLYISAADILDGTVPKERLQGTLALVGTSAVGLLDIRATPIEPRLPGVEVHANILENILEQNFVRYPFTMVLWEMIAIFVAGVALIVFVPRVGPVVTLAGLLVAGGGIAATSWYLFIEEKIFLDVSYPAGMVFAVYAVLAFSNYARDAAEKRQVRGAFSQYLSPDLVEQLAENPDQLRLGGETKKMTLLFCDVRGFTTISESFRADPQGLTRLINRLLTPLTNEILTRQGTIDKYMGDCIMAFWNAPLEDERQEAHACEAALAMFASLEALNEERRKEAEEGGFTFLPLNIGIGINTGECVVGNMGSDQRFDYSVLGDAVNLASRLEGQSKSYGVGTVIGDGTAASVRDELPVAELDLIAVKGKTEAVRIFTILGGPELREGADFATLLADHDAMLAAYRAKRFDEAEALIGRCEGQLDGVLDGFYAIYRERIAIFREEPPPEDWDGVFIATSK
ncbi:adenylate/guanylate cyclase domain-containing protein [Marivibrio halodurans]|uniref:Adenylate/guanylate cyclase domain-containing protein n=1 Tax=Marivibrio halodurans TaxID=2039722 RepID=A0A8J7SM52_9PROT|nr:adenylate/guanylate cyclase domain-containing protein [Marivibrio halodurans]